MGDAQPAYDVEVCNGVFVAKLRAHGIDPQVCSTDAAEKLRIEVKSKLSQTEWGRASVVHCSDIKLNGRCSKTGVHSKGMTHLAIVIVDAGIESPEDKGRITNAWLVSVERACELRRKLGKTQFIAVAQLRSGRILMMFWIFRHY
jgi:hypothetical protein